MNRITQRIIRTAAVTVALFAAGLAVPAFAQDAHIGTWKGDIAKTKFIVNKPVGPAPMSVTRTYEMFGDGLTFKQTVVRADGQSSTTSWSAHFDGKDYPFVGAQGADTIAVKRVNASTLTTEIKKAGKVVMAVRNTVSPDGKTMTNYNKGTNAQGQPYTNETFFEKQ